MMIWMLLLECKRHMDRILQWRLKIVLMICPIPVIVDGNHRFMAAMWLHDQGKMEKVHCMYGGRTDLLDYLTGNTEEQPLE